MPLVLDVPPGRQHGLCHAPGDESPAVESKLLGKLGPTPRQDADRLRFGE